MIVGQDWSVFKTTGPLADTSPVHPAVLATNSCVASASMTPILPVGTDIAQQVRRLDLQAALAVDSPRVEATPTGYSVVSDDLCLPWSVTSLPWTIGLRSYLHVFWDTVGPLWSVLSLAREVSVVGRTLTISVLPSDVAARASAWLEYVLDSRLSFELREIGPCNEPALIVNRVAVFDARSAAECAWSHCSVSLACLEKAVDALVPEHRFNAAQDVHWYLQKADVMHSGIQLTWDTDTVEVFGDTYDLGSDRLVLGDHHSVDDYQRRSLGLEDVAQRHVPVKARGIYSRASHQPRVSLVWPCLVWAGSAVALDLKSSERVCWRLGDRLVRRVALLDLLGLSRCTKLTTSLTGPVLRFDGTMTVATVWPLLSLQSLRRLRDTHALETLSVSATCIVDLEWNTDTGHLCVNVRRHAPLPQRLVWHYETVLVAYVE